MTDPIFIAKCADCGGPVAVIPSTEIAGGYLWYCSDEKCKHAKGEDVPLGKKPKWAGGDVDISTRRVEFSTPSTSEKKKPKAKKRDKGDDNESGKHDK